ncbi:MAG: type I-E CRISPR-associated protein Cas5/CasD [Anaerolineae bacterium]
MAGRAPSGGLTMANTLFLRLEGPLQAWGERAHWEYRDTSTEPTKSGIIGLLACALGLEADPDLRDLSQSLCFGVRCDRPGVILEDYHTVVGGVLSAEGKVKVNGKTHQPETVVSHREYLCDASFLVAVRGQPEIIQSLGAALQAPVWPPFLGRRSCPPSVPFFEGTGDYENLEEALATWHAVRIPQVGKGGDRPLLRAVIECEASEGVRRNDNVISRACRSFGPRYTRDVPVSPPTREEAI